MDMLTLLIITGLLGFVAFLLWLVRVTHGGTQSFPWADSEDHE